MNKLDSWKRILIHIKYICSEWVGIRKILISVCVSSIPGFILFFLLWQTLSGIPFQTASTQSMILVKSTFFFLLYWVCCFSPLLLNFRGIISIIRSPYENGTYLLLFYNSNIDDRINSAYSFYSRRNYYIGVFVASLISSFIFMLINFIIFYSLLLLFIPVTYQTLSLITPFLLTYLLIGIGFNFIFISLFMLLNYYIPSNIIQSIAIVCLGAWILLPLMKLNIINLFGREINLYYSFLIYFDPIQIMYNVSYINWINSGMIPYGLQFSTEQLHLMIPLNLLYTHDNFSFFTVSLIVALILYLTLLPLLGFVLLFKKAIIIKEEQLE